MSEIHRQVKNGLSKGWNWMKVKDIAENIQYGYTESSSREAIGPKFLRITDIQNNNVLWETVPYCKIDDNLKKKYLIRDGDLLFARTGATVGKSFLIKGNIPESVFASYLIRVRFNEKVLDKYIYYYFQTTNYWKQITEGQVGIGQPNVNGTKLGQLFVPIPSLEEQKQIVSKIEELFSELEKSIEQLKIAQLQFKVYRQSVLKHAFEEKFINKNVKVKEVAKVFGGYAFKSNEYKDQGEYQVIRMGNVRPGIIRFDESPIFLDLIDGKVLEKSLLKINDIIITQTGTRKKRDYGFTALISKSNLLLNQRIAGIRFKETYLPKFFLYYSWTDYFRDQFFANETGNVGQGNVGIKAVTEALIPLCSIVEQKKVIEETESRLSVTDKIEETIQNNLQRAEALKQGILKKAFEGKLH